MGIKTSVIRQATFWSTLTEIVAKLISPVVNMILARLLTPEAFGVVATITMVTSFADIFTDAGFQKYIVQHEFKSKKELDNNTNVAFWTNFALSSLIVIIIFILRNKIAILVGSPGLGNSISIASIMILLTSFSSIQNARYKRDFNFKTTFYVRIIGALIPLFITVPLAILLKNYWALILGSFASGIFRAVALTIKSPWKPGLFYKISIFKEMFSFSAWTLFESISIWLTSYAGTFIVGNYLNDYYLGLYKTTITTVNSIVSIVTASITPVLFSTLSRYQNDRREFNSVYFKFQRLTAVIVVPLGVGIWIYRDLITSILLGSQWTEISGFLGVYGFSCCLLVIFNNYNSEAIRSIGKPKVSLIIQILYMCFLIPILVIFVQKDFTIFTNVYGFAVLEICIYSFVSMYFLFKISFLQALKNVFPAIVSACVMGIAGLLLQGISEHILWQCFSILLCIIIYFAVLLLAFSGIRTEILQIEAVRKILKKFHAM